MDEYGIVVIQSLLQASTGNAMASKRYTVLTDTHYTDTQILTNPYDTETGRKSDAILAPAHQRIPNLPSKSVGTQGSHQPPCSGKPRVQCTFTWKSLKRAISGSMESANLSILSELNDHMLSC